MLTQDDEYVVYSTSQQRMRYLVEFSLAGDTPPGGGEGEDTAVEEKEEEEEEDEDEANALLNEGELMRITVLHYCCLLPTQCRCQM